MHHRYLRQGITVIVVAMATWGSGSAPRAADAKALAAAAPFAVRTLTADELPAGVKRPKGLEEAMSWTDKNGENLLLLSSWRTKSRDQGGDVEPSAFLTVDHLLLSGGQVRATLRSVRDGIEACPVDLTVEFRSKAEVTDLDRDGLAEVTFAYAISCKGDISPDVLKLVVIENGEKYILRGEERYETESAKMRGGGFKPDPAPASWPKALLAHAKTAWKQLLQ